MSASNSQQITNAQNGHSAEMLKLCMELPYSDKNRIRLNITENVDAFAYTHPEMTVVRMSLIPPAPVGNDEVPMRTPSVPLSHVINSFNVGTLSAFASMLQGIQYISFNTYKITMRTENSAKELLQRFCSETTAKGRNDEEIFQFQISDFMDPVVPLTLFPIPASFSDVQIKDIIENVLELGAMENCSWGRHRQTEWRNGFVHVRVRTKRTDFPDRITINRKPITILKNNEKLYRPCPLCNMRNHEVKFCPAFYHFEDFLLEKQKQKEAYENFQLNKIAQQEEAIIETQKYFHEKIGGEDNEKDNFASSLLEDNFNKTPPQHSHDIDALNLSIIASQPENPLKDIAPEKVSPPKDDPLKEFSSSSAEEEEEDGETTADLGSLFTTKDTTMKCDTRSDDIFIPPSQTPIASIDTGKIRQNLQKDIPTISKDSKNADSNKKGEQKKSEKRRTSPLQKIGPAAKNLKTTVKKITKKNVKNDKNPG